MSIGEFGGTLFLFAVGLVAVIWIGAWLNNLGGR